MKVFIITMLTPVLKVRVTKVKDYLNKGYSLDNNEKIRKICCKVAI